MADDIAGFHARRYDTTTSMGRLFFTTIAALAQLERDQISERTRMELAHKKSKGQRVSGRIPYGSRLADDGVNLVAEPQEQRAVAIIQRMRGAGSTTRDIEKELQRLGLRPRNGWHWHPKVVLDLCQRPR